MKFFLRLAMGVSGLLALVSSSALAASADRLCAEVTSPLLRNVTFVDLESAYRDPCGHLRRIITTMEKVAALFPDEPEQAVSLIVYARDSQAEYSIGGMLFLPESPEEYLAGISSDAYDAIIAHEYGHHFLNALMVRQLSDLRQGREIISKSDSLKVLADFMRSHSADSPDNKNRVAAELKHVQQQLDELSENSEANAILERASATMSALGGYHELFADLVAVLVFDDLSVMYRSLSSLPSRISDAELRYRDFAAKVPPKNWHIIAQHLLFAPTRGYLGTVIRERVHDLADQRELVAAVSRAMDHHFKLARNYSGNMNETLIAEIQTQISASPKSPSQAQERM